MTSENQVLEEILAGFDSSKDRFAKPHTLSKGHRDVTVKYTLSMLKIDQDKKAEVIDSFCERFDVDKGQMSDLLSDPNNNIEYGLYTAMSAHVQQKLGISTEDFFRQTTENTFLDYQNDPLIAAAKFIPINFLLNQMGSQFENWSIVTDTRTKKIDGKVHITRSTKPEYRRLLQNMLGEDAAKLALYRDCDISIASFRTTFQKLYGQTDLPIDRVATEMKDGSEYSEYVVGRRKSVWKRIFDQAKLLYAKAPALLFPGLIHENRSLMEDAFLRKATIRNMTNNLSHANAQLEQRQELIVGLLTEIARIRSSGDRHGIRNFLQSIYASEKETVVQTVSFDYARVWHLSEGDKLGREYLEALAEPFGIDNFDSPNDIADILHQVTIHDVDPESSPETVAPSDDGDLFDFADMLGLFQTDYVTAIKEAREVESRFEEKIKETVWEGYNPFVLLGTLYSIGRIMNEMNAQFKSIGKMNILDSFPFGSTLEKAVATALREKKSDVTITTDILYNPELSSNQDTFGYMLRDLVYNSIDAGATKVQINSLSPSGEISPPYLDTIGFNEGEFPAFYFVVEDDAGGIPQSKADELMAYLRGDSTSTATLSTKGKSEDEGGLGTKNLKRVLELHNGKAIYEPFIKDDVAGTRVHVYLQRLKI
jgi:signal transduction histidine kinase